MKIDRASSPTRIDSLLCGIVIVVGLGFVAWAALCPVLAALTV